MAKKPTLPEYLLKASEGYKLEQARAKSAISSLPLPIPHDGQVEILSSKAIFKVVCCGRQFGKTEGAAMSAVGGSPEYGGRGLLDGAYVQLSSPSQKQADLFWDYISAWLAPLFKVEGFHKNESKRVIRYRGGQLTVKTASDPDSLRGPNVDKLILDECAFLDPRAWEESGMPMLLARDGVAEFYSTPKRRNWFFHLYWKAKSDTTGTWQAWNMPSFRNPHLSKRSLALLTENMTEEAYRQEILAEFLEGGGAVFRYVEERCTGQPAEPRPFAKYVYGVDWAQSQDYTVIVVMDANTKKMVAMDRFNGIGWELQRGRLKVLCEKYPPFVIWAEANSIGSPNIEALQLEGLPVEGFMTTGASKPPLIESLVLAFERGEVECLNDPALIGELMAYERKVTPTGRSQYSAPEGLHDDTVIATALAWYGIASVTMPMYAQMVVKRDGA